MKNLKVCSGVFYSFSDNLKDLDVCKVIGSKNIECWAYDIQTNTLYVKMKTGKIYEYREVSMELMNERGRYGNFPKFYNERIKGKSFAEIQGSIEEVYPFKLYKYIKKLEHHKSTTVGLFATDVPDKVSDPEQVLFQIEFTG